MKYDEATGKQIPQNRTDEIKLSMLQLEDMIKESKYKLDSTVETAWILHDINVSLALLVDMVAMMINERKKKDDERT